MKIGDLESTAKRFQGPFSMGLVGTCPGDNDRFFCIFQQICSKLQVIEMNWQQMNFFISQIKVTFFGSHFIMEKDKVDMDGSHF